MGLLESMIEALESPTVSYNDFLLHYKKNENSIHIFHEGKDDPSFYGNFISTKAPNRKIFYYSCKGKSYVYRYHSSIDWNKHSKKRVLFFVDKDYSLVNKTYISDENIFTTKYYSIENYIVNEAMFERTLRDFYGLDNLDAMELACACFRNGLVSFHKCSIVVSAYIIFHKRRQDSLNLSKLQFSHIYSILSDLTVKRNKSLIKSLDSSIGVTSINIFVEVLSICRDLENMAEPKEFVRGKLEVLYFLKCIEYIAKKIRDKGYRCRTSISTSNIISLLAPRLPIPEDLDIFLSSVLNKD